MLAYFRCSWFTHVVDLWNLDIKFIINPYLIQTKTFSVNTPIRLS
jgi:hypothetical protein